MGVMFFQDGAPLGSDAGWGGFTGSHTYVVRYDFRTPAQGASQLAIALDNIWYGHGAGSQSFGFRLSASPTEFAAARAVAPQSNSTQFHYSAQSGYSCTLWAQGLNLLPDTTYYLFVYVVTEGAEYYTGWNCVSPQIALGGRYTPPVSALSSVSSAVTTGEAVSIILRRSGSNRHKASFYYGTTLLAQSDAFESSLSYVCPRSWLAQDSSARSIEIKVSIQCYADAACMNPVGQPLETSFSLTADAGMCPKFTASALSITAVNLIPTLSQFVANISRARIEFDRTRIDLNDGAGARIAALRVNGQSAAGDAVVTETLKGETALVCTVVDTRGLENSVTVTISPLPYVAPSLTGIEAKRCDADGTDNAEGLFCKLKCSALCAEISGNSCAVSVALDGRETALTGFESGVWSDEWAMPLLLGGALTGDSYTLRFTVGDTLGGSASYMLPLYSSQWAMKFNHSGTAVGFGMEPTRDNALQVPEHWRLCGAIPVLSPLCYGTAAPESAVTSPVEGQLYLRITP